MNEYKCFKVDEDTGETRNAVKEDKTRLIDNKVTLNGNKFYTKIEFFPKENCRNLHVSSIRPEYWENIVHNEDGTITLVKEYNE